MSVQVSSSLDDKGKKRNKKEQGGGRSWKGKLSKENFSRAISLQDLFIFPPFTSFALSLFGFLQCFDSFSFPGVHGLPETHLHAAGWILQDFRAQRHGGRLPEPVSVCVCLFEHESTRINLPLGRISAVVFHFLPLLNFKSAAVNEDASAWTWF